MDRAVSEPNSHGVYSDADATESFILPRNKPGWRGVPIAEIRLLLIEAGWIEATTYNTFTGSCHGGGYGLSAKWGVYPSRQAALDHAIAGLRRKIAKDDGPDCRQIGAWLDSLVPDQADLFAGMPPTTPTEVR